MSKNGYGDVSGQGETGNSSGYGNVPGQVPGNIPGYGRMPTGNPYGSVPGRDCAAANAILSAAGISAPSFDLPVDDFAMAVNAGGYDAVGSALNSPVAAKANTAQANDAGGGYDTVVLSAEAQLENALDEAARANGSRKHAIWDQLFRAFTRDVNNRLLPTGRIKQLSSTNYIMEGIDPKHRMGDLLADCLNIYKERQPTVPFFEWLDSKGEFDQVVILREARELATGTDQYITPSTVRAFVRGVAYLDASTNSSYKISIINGKLYQNGRLFDTSDLSTVFSGKGHAIFIQSPSRDFYSSSHKLGEFHHSSFLSGAGVKSAGEWIVKQGDLKWLSAKSGHYKPEMYHYVQGIQYLKDKNAISAQTTARVYDSQGAMNLHAMTLLNPVEASKWSVWG